MTRMELIEMLAIDRCEQYPKLYEGRRHLGDARIFAENHLGPRKRDLLLSAACRGLVPFEVVP